MDTQGQRSLGLKHCQYTDHWVGLSWGSKGIQESSLEEEELRDWELARWMEAAV